MLATSRAQPTIAVHRQRSKRPQIVASGVDFHLYAGCSLFVVIRDGKKLSVSLSTFLKYAVLTHVLRSAFIPNVFQGLPSSPTLQDIYFLRFPGRSPSGISYPAFVKALVTVIPAGESDVIGTRAVPPFPDPGSLSDH